MELVFSNICVSIMYKGSLFLVPTLFPKCRFHDVTPTAVTFKEGAHQFMGALFLVSKVSPVGKFHCIEIKPLRG